MSDDETNGKNENIVWGFDIDLNVEYKEKQAERKNKIKLGKTLTSAILRNGSVMDSSLTFVSLIMKKKLPIWNQISMWSQCFFLSFNELLSMFQYK